MVVIELTEGGRGWVVLDSAVGSGATVVVVAMEGETGSSNAGCIDDGSVCRCVPRDRNSATP